MTIGVRPPATSVATWVESSNALFSNGESVFARTDESSTATLSTGTLRIVYLTARRTETITQVGFYVVTTVATLTLCRVGIYAVDSSDVLTSLLASTANATTACASSGLSTLSLTSSFSKVQGTRYAVALLSVGASNPVVTGLSVAATAANVSLNRAPRLVAALGSQTDLPSGVPTPASTNIVPQVLLLQ